MIFESRKLYPHGQNTDIFLVQIPKLVSKDIGLTKETRVDITYDNDKIIITKCAAIDAQ